ncbi:MAG: N-acetyl-gamma-glutamyl-phosphate reductase [Kiritimatiellia bacterium]
MKIKAKIVGAGGYGGCGLMEILSRHPDVEIACLVAKDDVNKPVTDVYPHLHGFVDLPIVAADAPEAREAFDVVFFSTPDKVGMTLAAAERAKGAKVIDFSGDFRFRELAEYEEYARRISLDPQHAAPDLLPASVYGLPELGLDPVSGADLVGNPGCFAVSVLLGFAPALQAGLVDPLHLIADCKTGVSGAGKKPNPLFHFPARHDHMNAYRLSGHQHVCEVEQNLSKLGGTPAVLTFTAQVVPATRGILSTLYARLESGITREKILEVYRNFYAGAAFVKVFDRSAATGLGTAHVRGSNQAFLIVDADERTGTLRVVSHIDNLMKGQAGSAVQNMNLMFGLPETAGLDQPGSYP